MTHANAPLTPAGRLRLAPCIVDEYSSQCSTPVAGEPAGPFQLTSSTLAPVPQDRIDKNLRGGPWLLDILSGAVIKKPINVRANSNKRVTPSVENYLARNLPAQIEERQRAGFARRQFVSGKATGASLCYHGQHDQRAYPGAPVAICYSEIVQRREQTETRTPARRTTLQHPTTPDSALPHCWYPQLQ